MAPRALLLLTAILFLPACAAMEQANRDQVCHRDHGYEQGANDGRAHRPMDSSFAGVCDPQTRQEIGEAYRRGYESVRPGNNFDDDDGAFRMKGGGFDIRVPGRPNNKRWVCEVEAFGRTFSGFGASRGEAAQNARTSCENVHNGMHCSEVSCDKGD